MPNILYLHGANMTETSFSYIKMGLGDHKYICPEYSVEVPLEENIKKISKLVKKQFKKPVTVISHSLGGIIALDLYHHGLPIEKIITISTPFGGSKTADKLRWIYPSCQLLEDIRSRSPFVRELVKKPVDIPILSFVSITGHIPFIDDLNDGVVSIKSQMMMNGPEYVKIALNHTEILMSDEVIEKIKLFLK